jgi:hypothetical protein
MSGKTHFYISERTLLEGLYTMNGIAMMSATCSEFGATDYGTPSLVFELNFACRN